MNPWDKTFCDQIIADAKGYGYDMAAFVNGRFIYTGDMTKAVGEAYKTCAEDPDPRVSKAMIQLGRDIDYKLNSSVMDATLRDLQLFIQRIPQEEIDGLGYYRLNTPGHEEYSLHVYSHRLQFNVCRKDQFGIWLCIGCFVFLDAPNSADNVVQCYSAVKGTALYDNPKNYSPSTRLGDINWKATFPYEGDTIGDIIKLTMSQHPPKKEDMIRSRKNLPMIDPITFEQIREWILVNYRSDPLYLFDCEYSNFYPKLFIKRRESLSPFSNQNIYDIWEDNDNNDVRMLGFLIFWPERQNGSISVVMRYFDDTEQLNQLGNIRVELFNMEDTINSIGVNEEHPRMARLKEILYKMVAYPDLKIWEM